MVSLPDQLSCVKRELALRRNVYPKWVASGRMKKEKADHEIAAMEAVVATVQKVLDLAEVSEEWKKEREVKGPNTDDALLL